jgi:hypothetical protein
VAHTISPQQNTSVVGTISGVSGLAAIGTNIRQNPIFLKVEVAPGDPAALQRVAEQIRLEPRPDRVTDRGRDFPGLVGRSTAVSTALEAITARRSVASFGDDGIGKSVFLRHLAWRADAAFARGVVRLETGGRLWQDIAQEVVWAFFDTALPVYLGPTHLREILGNLDALVLLDDVDEGAQIDQLYALMENAAFVLAGRQRLLAGESRAIHLDGLDGSATETLVSEAAADAGEMSAVEPAVARRIGAVLGGNPGRIIRAVEDALARGVDLGQLAAELEAGAADTTADAVARLSHIDRAVVAAVDALDGAPVGPEHVAAVVADASETTVEALEARRILRVASPQVRLDEDIAAATYAEADRGDQDSIRGRFLEHYITWASSGRPTPAQIADESRAILALLAWAERRGRAQDAHALAVATEGAFALAGRWGTWTMITEHRLRAAKALGLRDDEAIALNQLGVQALARDDATSARELFATSRDVAHAAGADAVAATATRNLEIIDYPLAPPSGSNGNGGWLTPPRALGGGLLGLAFLVGLLIFLNLDRPALAIEPASMTFAAATVETDGEQVTFDISNAGSTTLEALDVSLSGEAADDFYIVGGDCPGTTLEREATCSVVLLFHPGPEGGGQATLNVTAGDGTVATAMVEGLAAEPSVEPTPSDLPPATETPPPPTDSPTPIVAEPDLVIDTFSLTGLPDSPDDVLIPVKVVIGNAGDGEAGVFPIVITADGQPVAFEVPGESPQGLVTREPLGPGEHVAYEGAVRLPPDVALDRVRLVVEADSCALEAAGGEGCRVAESNEKNNSLQLQAVDLQLQNVGLGVARQPAGIFLKPADTFEVDFSFEIHNGGTIPAGEFWIAGFLGQLRADLRPTALEYDEVRSMPHVPGLDAGGDLHLDGTATGAATSVESPLTIDVGCPPLADPCFVPEIAYDNNWTAVTIPLPTPTPTPEPPIID